MLDIEYPGHINVLVCDHDSAFTGYGKHDRVQACRPRGGEFWASVDDRWKLGMPTDAEIVKASKAIEGFGGRWRADHSRDVQWTSPSGSTVVAITFVEVRG